MEERGNCFLAVIHESSTTQCHDERERERERSEAVWLVETLSYHRDVNMNTAPTDVVT